MQTLSEARLASVLDTAVDGIIVIDEGSRILAFNKACEELFGYQASEVVGRNVKFLMPDRYADNHDGYMDNYMATGERKIIGIGRAVHGRRSDGEVFPLELSVGESQTPFGRQFVGIVRDLRPKIEAQERVDALQAQLIRMERANAMDEMGSALAHELNQPLTAVMLYLQAVTRKARRDLSSEDARLSADCLSVIDKAIEEADRAGKIIQHMRRFIENREVERVDLALAQVVDEAIDFALVGNRAKGIAVHRSHAEALPHVFGDPVQIQQVIVNLVRNAFDALQSADDKVIDVTTRQDGERVIATIADSGPGVSPDIMPDLFRAFATSKPSGTGLGLAISRTIAQSHGGDLIVDPGGCGRGAQFSLVLPCARHEQPQTRVPEDVTAGAER